MAASLSITPASGSITAAVSVCRIDVAGASANDPDDGSEKRYRVKATATGVDDLVSHEFNVNGGAHRWDNLIFPEAGSWTLHLVDLADDSDAATLAVTVS